VAEGQPIVRLYCQKKRLFRSTTLLIEQLVVLRDQRLISGHGDMLRVSPPLLQPGAVRKTNRGSNPTPWLTSEYTFSNPRLCMLGSVRLYGSLCWAIRQLPDTAFLSFFTALPEKFREFKRRRPSGEADGCAMTERSNLTGGAGQRLTATLSKSICIRPNLAKKDAVSGFKTRSHGKDFTKKPCDPSRRSRDAPH